ncbi:MAG: sel1 repeat family protein [Akkermansiaceae bacterium]|nr:sel1 repeat family protein [Akkermansiaceae bacterium]
MKQKVYISDVEQLSPEQLESLLESAEQGDAAAMHQYAVQLFVKDDSDCVSWLKKAVRLKHVEATADLGMLFTYGIHVKKDEKYGFQLLKRAAESKNSYAQMNLGLCFLYGKGTKRNYKQAAYWFAQAVEQGNMDAVYELAECYFSGCGVKQDMELACRMYLDAAENGNVEAMNALGSCYMSGNGVEKDELQGLYWTQKSAEAGYFEAMMSLAHIYMFGTEKIMRDHTLARCWMRAAVEAGSLKEDDKVEDALGFLDMLDDLKSQGVSGEIKLSQAILHNPNL